jgi:hypothetical protein
MSKTIKKTILLVFCLTVVLALSPTPSYADDWDKATKITVNQPFEIPGMVLPAGTYIVKLVGMPGDHNIVRFLSEDQTKVYSTLIAIPDFRLETTDNTVLTFYEALAGSPKALRSWFYPGHQDGVEFAYPKKRATEIAAFTGETVPALNEPEPLPVFREKPTPAPVVEEPAEAPTIAEEFKPEEVVIPEVPEPEPAGESLPVLPKTATPFPLFALVGLLAGGAASGLRWVRKHE